jgi:hypothetical protein
MLLFSLSWPTAMAQLRPTPTEPPPSSPAPACRITRPTPVVAFQPQAPPDRTPAGQAPSFLLPPRGYRPGPPSYSPLYFSPPCFGSHPSAPVPLSLSCGSFQNGVRRRCPIHPRLPSVHPRQSARFRERSI